MGLVRGRILSPALSTSRRFAALYIQAGELAEFAQSLYPLLIVHADDEGRFDGDPWTVKQIVLPASPRPPESFAQALAALTAVEMLWKSEADGHISYEISHFKRYQRLKYPSPSRFPAPSTGRREEKRSEEKRREENTRLRRGQLFDTLADCAHVPRCVSLPMCRKVTALTAAVGEGTITAHEGARLIALWRAEVTMVPATLRKTTRHRAAR